ncbi:MAG: serine/threonine protein phosphatase [Devosia sp.]|nr:serine/threonine protein phosphatase [Devosia sp.]
MLTALRSLLGLGGRADRRPGRVHMLANSRPSLVYAIGDIHGCLAELAVLERMIVADAIDTDGEKWIVTLGDYIDRGPAAAQVVDHLMARPPVGFRRICLAGNHEQMLLDFLEAPRQNVAWLDNGGLETAHSYGLSDLALQKSPTALAAALVGRMPASHREWLANLPSLLAIPGFVFVHAGLRPGVPLDEQTDDDLMWIREPFLDNPAAGDAVVVHGHTPVAEPIVTASHIGIDTAVAATGRLTALRLDRDNHTSFLSTR